MASTELNLVDLEKEVIRQVLASEANRVESKEGMDLWWSLSFLILPCYVSTYWLLKFFIPIIPLW